MKKEIPLFVYILWLLIAIQTLQGLAGGLLMLFDPTGKSLRMPLLFLMGSPFPDYFVPGLFLLVFLGILPLLALIGLMTNSWKWPNIINIYKDRHWGWTFSLYVGLILVLWMDLQISFIGYWHKVQTLHAINGVVILIFTLLPPVMEYYRVKEDKE
ncbi:MAG: hypothetical protein V5A47_02515 [Bacteroidales bacterium]|nr:hypothetical protein [Bacteroidales bacterium]MBS3773686.1 hypothetical protein [Bacteroidales bacterium]